MARTKGGGAGGNRPRVRPRAGSTRTRATMAQREARIERATAQRDSKAMLDAMQSDDESGGEEPGDGGHTGVGELNFQPRALPVKKFDRDGFLVYVIFLAAFLVSHIGDRSSDQYYFAAAVKDLFAAPEFGLITSPVEYYEWLAVHFLPSMAAYSVDNAPGAAFSIVGAPRMKQLRGANCTAAAYMDHVVSNCYSNEDDTQSYGGLDGKAFIWSDSDEPPHFSPDLGTFYSSAGFLVPDTMMQSFLEEPSGASPYRRSSPRVSDISALEEAGWWDARTRVVFHDFTVYSASMDAFMAVRLTVELGLGHGTMLVSQELRYLELRKLGGFTQLAEYFFYAMLALLIMYEGREFLQWYMRPGQLLTEHIIQLRYVLRLKKLHHGAFQKIVDYDPQRVLSRLTKRLFDKYRQDKMKDKGQASVKMVELSRDHINFLNAIGQRVVALHETYCRMVDSGFKSDFTLASVVDNKDDDAQFQASLAVIDLLDDVRKLHKAKADLEELKRIEGSKITVSRFSPAQFRIRIFCAVRGYFRDRWNVRRSAAY